jgi:cytochrome c
VRSIALLVVAAGFAACEAGETQALASELAGGDPHRGAEAIVRRGCASCHTIPGIRGADALVGPALERVASRAYLAGVLVNRPDNLIAWLQDPPGVDPKTAMPNLGIGEDEARDIASYLYTLR